MTVDGIIKFYDGDKNSIRTHLLRRHGCGPVDKADVILISRLHIRKDFADVAIEALGVEHFTWMPNRLDRAKVVIYFDRHQGVTKLLKNRYGAAGQIIRDSDEIGR